jgi:hypothetical protein
MSIQGVRERTSLPHKEGGGKFFRRSGVVDLIVDGSAFVLNVCPFVGALWIGICSPESGKAATDGRNFASPLREWIRIHEATHLRERWFRFVSEARFKWW